MPLVIPDGFVNAIITISNSSAGISAKSTISQAFNSQNQWTQATAGRIANIFRDALAPCLDNGFLIGPCRFVYGKAGSDEVWEDTGTEAGTRGAQTYGPPANAFVVSKVSGLAGVRNRGRLYMPGVADNDVGEDGIVQGATVNLLQAAFDDLFSDLEADADIQALDILHDSSTPGSQNPTQQVGYVVRNVVGTMRPRQRR